MTAAKSVNASPDEKKIKEALRLSMDDVEESAKKNVKTKSAPTSPKGHEKGDEAKSERHKVSRSHRVCATANLRLQLYLLTNGIGPWEAESTRRDVAAEAREQRSRRGQARSYAFRQR